MFSRMNCPWLLQGTKNGERDSKREFKHVDVKNLRQKLHVCACVRAPQSPIQCALMFTSQLAWPSPFPCSSTYIPPMPAGHSRLQLMQRCPQISVSTCETSSLWKNPSFSTHVEVPFGNNWVLDYQITNTKEIFFFLHTTCANENRLRSLMYKIPKLTVKQKKCTLNMFSNKNRDRFKFFNEFWFHPQSKLLHKARWHQR